MRRPADIPVVVIGDIDRGGGDRQPGGTKTVIPDDDAALIVGFIINKMRGDISLFTMALKIIETLIRIGHNSVWCRILRDVLNYRKKMRWADGRRCHGRCLRRDAGSYRGACISAHLQL